MTHSIATWLDGWNRFGPDRTALVWGPTGERRTYRELHRATLRRAAWLRDVHGVGPGDRVAWLDRNRPEFFETLFACARLGAILCPVNWRLADPEVEWLLENVEPTVALEGDGIAPLDGPVPRVEPFDAGADTPLLILHTSGTTGRPKGAILTHGSMTANSLHTTVACDLGPSDATVTYTPLFHTGGVNVLSLPLLHRGGKVVLLPGFDAGAILTWGAREDATILFGVPTTFRMILEDPAFEGADLSAIRFALCGGAPCPVELIEAWAERGVVFRQGYGLTEVGPNCFSLPPEDAVRKAGTVGFPVLGTRAKVVDEEGREVPRGEVGELWLKGPHVCAGYWRNPGATEAALTDGWWATGDLFTVDEEGYHRVVGRSMEMFISGGENVYPAEVEAALREVEGVEDACVVGVPDATWGEVGRAFVEPAGVDADAVRAALDGRIARFKIPKRVVPLEALPQNASNKVDRRALEARAREEHPAEVATGTAS